MNIQKGDFVRYGLARQFRGYVLRVLDECVLIRSIDGYVHGVPIRFGVERVLLS